MYVRVAVATLKPGAGEAAQRKWTEYLEMFRDRGLHNAYMLVDPGSLRMMSVSIWETKAAEEGYAESPEQSRGRAEMSAFFAEPLSVSRYRVAAHVG